MSPSATLSAERREKKRKNDRDAQRLARERTRARVKELEALVQTLQAVNEHPEQMSQLLAQLQAARETNMKLQDRMRKAVELLDPGMHTRRDENDHQANDQSFQTVNQYSTPMAQKKELSLNAPAMQIFDDIATFKATEDPSMFSSQLLETLSDVGLHDCSDNMPPNTQLAHTCADLVTTKPTGNTDSAKNDPVANIAAMFLNDQSVEGRFWLLASTILNYILSMAEDMFTPRALDDDIAIRSCLEGWESVNRRYWLDSGWRWLRQLDEHMYRQLSIPNRMAIMRMMRMKYLIQRQPARASTLDLPQFMTARPAQEQILHESLVEHFVWPGIREHFLFSPTRYATNRFMENFRNLLRFAWPHDTQDTYRLDSHSELYSFTPLYLHHQSQIECWQMDPEFFNLFPEFRGDIPTAVPSLSNPFTKHLDFGLTDLATGEEQSNERSDNALSLAVTT